MADKGARTLGVRLAQMVIAALLTVVAGSPAAAEPNFSGTWKLDKAQSLMPPPPKGLPNLLALGDVTLVVDHRGEMLKLERRVRFMGFERSHVLTYYTDGREAQNVNPQGYPLITVSHWEGDAVVTQLRGTVELDGKKEAIEGTDVVRLSANGQALVIESTRKRASNESAEIARLVFLKRSGSP